MVEAGARADDSANSLRVLLQFNDDLANDVSNSLKLSRLPWRSWRVFQNYRNIEIAFAPPEGSSPRLLKRRAVVRILMVVGNKQGIEQGVRRDIANIGRLKDLCAEIQVLEQPLYDDLRKELRDNPYEIVIFSGHSRSSEDGTTGWLVLNDNKDVDIRRLNEDLAVAIKNGLQLLHFQFLRRFRIIETRSSRLPYSRSDSYA